MAVLLPWKTTGLAVAAAKEKEKKFHTSRAESSAHRGSDATAHRLRHDSVYIAQQVSAVTPRSRHKNIVAYLLLTPTQASTWERGDGREESLVESIAREIMSRRMR